MRIAVVVAVLGCVGCAGLPTQPTGQPDYEKMGRWAALHAWEVCVLGVGGPMLVPMQDIDLVKDLPQRPLSFCNPAE